MKIEMKKFPDFRVAGLRHVGPYTEIGGAFGRLGTLAGAAGMLNTDSRMLAVYHDDPSTTSPEMLRSDAALCLLPHTKVPAELTEQVIPGGLYAVTVHRGAYATLPDAWRQMMHDIPATGATFEEGPSLEIYINNPMSTAKDDLLTEIRIPVTAG